MTTETSPELNSLELDFQQLEVDIDLEGMFFDESSVPEMMALDVELGGTEFAFADAELATFQATGDPMVDALIFGFIKNKARKAIKALVKFVKKHKSCLGCIDDVQRAVALFSAGKYPRALAAAVKAFVCIKKCLAK